ncbi:MAG: hypothetical protein ACLPWF_04355 [Bryobacteraceae bacterium]
MNEPPFSWRLVAANAVIKLAAFVSCGVLTWICWRLVGARPGYGAFFTAFSYSFAAWLLIFSLLLAIDESALRFLRPELFAQIIALGSSGHDTQKLKVLLGSEGTYAAKVLLDSDKEWPQVIQTPGLLWIASMAALRGVATFVWLIAAWAAFRNWLGVSWSRTIVSLAIFLCLGSLALLLAVFFQMAPIMVDSGRWLEKWSY